MKGVVFTEFLEMVEDTFGWEMAEEIIEAADLESGGVYTAVGTYPHTEMVALVTQLSQKSEVPIPDLLKAYGKHLFSVFTKNYGVFFEDAKGTFDFILKIDQYIHVEVKKLYPEAELPAFTYDQPSEDHLIVNYTSTRPFADFAEGLLMGCMEHFDEPVTLFRDPEFDFDGKSARFELTMA